MSWSAVRFGKATSQHAWLRTQRFGDEVAKAVLRSQLQKEGIERLEALHMSGCGKDGALSKAQRLELKLKQVRVNDGKMIGFCMGALPVGDGKQRPKTVARHCETGIELASLKKQIGELKIGVAATTAWA